MSDTVTTPATGERADLLEALRIHRFFLSNTLRELSDEQAALTPTVSALCLGGLVKHVASVEKGWAEFMTGNGRTTAPSQDDYAEHAAGFRMVEGDTVASVLGAYAEVAARTDELVATLDLDAEYPLPPAPWFEPGATRSVRRTVVHIIAETAQHAGHADIIRESIDGAKTMG